MISTTVQSCLDTGSGRHTGRDREQGRFDGVGMFPHALHLVNSVAWPLVGHPVFEIDEPVVKNLAGKLTLRQ